MKDKTSTPLMTRPKGHNPASDREIVQIHTVSQHYCGFCLLKFLNIQQALDVWINRYMLILRAMDKQMPVNTNFTVSTYKQKLNHQKLKNSFSSQDELLNQKVVLQIASEGMLVFRSQEVSRPQWLNTLWATIFICNQYIWSLLFKKTRTNKQTGMIIGKLNLKQV